MPILTVLDNPYATLWFNTESKIVHHKMHTFMPAGIFRDLLNAGAECLERYSAQKWLSDDRENTVVRQEDAEWARTVWAPRVVRAGFKYWAIVLPAKAPIGQVQMRMFIAEYEQLGVTVQVFEDASDAMKWLKSAGEAAGSS